MGGLNAPAPSAVPEPSPSSPMTILTLSFAGDFERCRVLCETMDRFVAGDAEHVVAVPSGDLALFGPLAGGGRRRLVAQEELIPAWLFKLPLPGPEWRKRLFLPRRNMYLSLRGRPVRGWIAQQMMKLAGAARLGQDIVLHCDSDLAFIRPVAADVFRRDGAVRLFRVPGAGDTAMHARWHRAASRLLGIAPSGYHGADYIGHLVTWRRPVVERLLARLAETGGRDAAAILAGTPDLSEYVLYGVFCEKVLGLAESGHSPDATDLCATVWSEPEAGTDPLAAAPIRPEHVGLGIQSTVAMSPERYRAVVETAIRVAAGQDRAGA